MQWRESISTILEITMDGSKYWKFLNKTLRILIFFQVDRFTSIFDIDVKELETQTLYEQFQ